MNEFEQENTTPTPTAPLLSESEIEGVLQQFRSWLTELNELPAPSEESTPTIDLATLTGHFTALRQEVNLQTKAFRTTITQLEPLQKLPEQLSDVQKKLVKSESPPPSSNDAEFKPLLKSLVDIHDSLVLAYRQVSKQSDDINELLNVDVLEPLEFPEEFNAPATSETPVQPVKKGFFAKLFGGKQTTPATGSSSDKVGELKEWHDSANELLAEQAQSLSYAQDRLATSLGSLLAGYEMSISRVEKAIEKAGLTAIETEGEPFDPEMMEVVDIVQDSEGTSGTVAEEVRRGYFRGQVVFRYAQVKVYR